MIRTDNCAVINVALHLGRKKIKFVKLGVRLQSVNGYKM